MAKRSKKKSRRSSKGLKGLTTGMARDVVPAAVGATLTLGTALGLRAYLRPEPGQTSEVVYRWAPAIGIGAGILGALGLYVVGGKRAGRGVAASAAVVSVITGGALLAIERVHANKPGAFAALVPSNGAVPAGTAGLRAISAEYGQSGTNGLSAIVMEQLNGNRQQQGATVDLRGTVDAGAFGTQPFA